MKGLLLKDWYLIRSYCRSFFLLDAAFIAVSLLAPGYIVFLAYPCMFSAMIPVTLYSYDDREKWLSYGAALPVSRAQHVSAKYIIGLFSLAAVFLANLLAHAAADAVMPGRAAAEYLPMLITASALGLLLPAVVLPLMFRFGAEKGRIVYLILVGVICAACFILLSNDGAPSVLEAYLNVPVFCGITLGLYAASWLLSIRLYSHREL